MIQIKFSTDNASFIDGFSKAVNHALLQVQNIVNDLEETSLAYPANYPIFDENGNKIGYIKYTK